MDSTFTLGGIPLHPLIVHLAVVAIPVAALGAVLIALLPRLNQRWVLPVFVTAVLGALGAGLAKMSGEALAEAKNLSEHAEPLAEHAQYSDLAVVSAILLTGMLFVYAVMVKKPELHSLLASPKLLLAVRALTLITAIAALITVILAGHEGAALVWVEEI